MLTYGSLFSGYGGLDLAVEAVTGARCLWQCEIEPYPQAVLAKHWPGVPKIERVEMVDAETPAPDILCGGFPCQDISQAGPRIGLDGPRSGLWRQYARVIWTLGAWLLFVENVSGILVRGHGEVLGDLADLGFDAEWSCFRASDVGAPHLRRRVFIVALRRSLSDAQRDAFRQLRERIGQQRREQGTPESRDDGEAVSDPAVEQCAGRSETARREAGDLPSRSSSMVVDANGSRWESQRIEAATAQGRSQPADAGRTPQIAVSDAGATGLTRFGSVDHDHGCHAPRRHVDRCHAWPPALDDIDGWARYDGARPGVRRGAYGPSRGVDARRRRDRLACLGNGVVPQQAVEAFERLILRF